MMGERRPYQTAAAAAAILLIGLGAAGCGGEEQETEKTSLRIGVSLYRGDDTFINNIRQELEACAKEYEQETGTKVRLDIQDAKGSQYTQNDQAERFISLECDALCINLVDRTAATNIIDGLWRAMCRWSFSTGSRWKRT